MQMNLLFICRPARTDRYHHSEEDDETNDDESYQEIKFSSCSHRFSQVK